MSSHLLSKVGALGSLQTPDLAGWPRHGGFKSAAFKEFVDGGAVLDLPLPGGAVSRISALALRLGLNRKPAAAPATARQAFGSCAHLASTASAAPAIIARLF